MQALSRVLEGGSAAPVPQNERLKRPTCCPAHFSRGSFTHTHLSTRHKPICPTAQKGAQRHFRCKSTRPRARSTTSSVPFSNNPAYSTRTIQRTLPEQKAHHPRHTQPQKARPKNRCDPCMAKRRIPCALKLRSLSLLSRPLLGPMALCSCARTLARQ